MTLVYSFFIKIGSSIESKYQAQTKWIADKQAKSLAVMRNIFLLIISLTICSASVYADKAYTQIFPQILEKSKVNSVEVYQTDHTGFQTSFGIEHRANNKENGLEKIRQNLMEEGVVHIPSFFNSFEIEKLRESVDEVIESHGLNVASYKILNIIEKTDKLDYLFNHEKLMPILHLFLGDYFQVLSSEIFVRGLTNKTSVEFHTDGGPSLQKILPIKENLLIQLKIQIFLTDMDNEESGNFMYIPGSHLKLVKDYVQGCYIPELNDELRMDKYPKGTKQVLAKAGDILIFPWSLWHGVSKNTSKDTRKSISIRYGQLWCKPMDYFTLRPETMARLNDEQKRMFGCIHPDMNHPSYYYRPGEVEYRKNEILAK